jgi:hypothetical protein
MLRFAAGNMESDMGTTTGTTRLDDIQDPEVGLALVSGEPPNDTPEQRMVRKFWRSQFEQWRDWKAGDSLAIPRAIHCCRITNRPPPRWLDEASVESAERRMSSDERERQNDFARHLARWEAVVASHQRERELRAKSPDAPHVSWADHFERAAEAEILSREGAVADSTTVGGSYKLIQRAGGRNATLESYKREAQKFNRRRKKHARK